MLELSSCGGALPPVSPTPGLLPGGLGGDTGCRCQGPAACPFLRAGWPRRGSWRLILPCLCSGSLREGDGQPLCPSVQQGRGGEGGPLPEDDLRAHLPTRHGEAHLRHHPPPALACQPGTCPVLSWRPRTSQYGHPRALSPATWQRRPAPSSASAHAFRNAHLEAGSCFIYSLSPLLGNKSFFPCHPFLTLPHLHCKAPPADTVVRRAGRQPAHPWLSPGGLSVFSKSLMRKLILAF